MVTDTRNPNPVTRLPRRVPVHVERVDFMTMDDVRRRVGLSPNGARELVARAGFPAPFARVWRSDLWRAVDVETWCSEQAARGWIYEPDEG